MRVRLPRAVVVAIGLIVAAVFAGAAEIWPQVLSSAHAGRHVVTYRVEGTGPAHVEYGATAGPTRTKVNVTLPFSITLTMTPETPTLYTVYAKVVSPVLPTCSIEVDGQKIAAVVATAYNARECSYRP